MPSDGETSSSGSTRPVRPLEEVTAADLRASTAQFAELIAVELPLQFDSGELWPAVAYRFLARAGDLVDSLTILTEAKKEADAEALLRMFLSW